MVVEESVCGCGVWVCESVAFVVVACCLLSFPFPFPFTFPPFRIVVAGGVIILVDVWYGGTD